MRARWRAVHRRERTKQDSILVLCYPFIDSSIDRYLMAGLLSRSQVDRF